LRAVGALEQTGKSRLDFVGGGGGAELVLSVAVTILIRVIDECPALAAADDAA